MSFEIYSLNSNNQEDFFSLFEADNFGHSRGWGNCFCRYYQTNCSFEDWMNRSALVNHEDASKAIKEGTMHGFLAYENNKCVGWLNASSILNYPRILVELPKKYHDSKIALTICFVIEESHRQKKVASRLLDHAIEHFFSNGYSAMISLPRNMKLVEQNYRGFKEMYQNRGYTEVEEGILILKNLLDQQ